MNILEMFLTCRGYVQRKKVHWHLIKMLSCIEYSTLGNLS